MPALSRRDILKLSGALVGGAALASLPLGRQARRAATDAPPSFIVLVLDSLSARNLSLLGYSRPTSPALERLADQCTVYHSHYAGGSFTTPGVATLLTGLYPWTHRAFNLRGMLPEAFERQNIFAFLGQEYTRLAYTHNQLAYILLSQFERDLDLLLNRNSFILRQNAPTPEDAFANDAPVSFIAFNDFMHANESQASPASLSLGLADMLGFQQAQSKPAPGYPRGYPSNFQTYFKVEDLLSGLAGVSSDLSRQAAPFFAYFHLLPPHAPYNPYRKFVDPFLNDGLAVPSKPEHPLAMLDKAPDKLLRLRLFYDAFVANVDYEVGRFCAALEAARVLEHTYLIITSDHGELFERGEYGHVSPLLYDPLVHVPLIVRAPGQNERRDVYLPTSNADLAPTILSLAGRAIPPTLDGRLLPGLGGIEEAERAVYTVYAMENSAFLPLDTSIVSMRKDRHRLMYYRGYPGYNDRMELYDLEQDPEELRDLSTAEAPLAKRMKEELLEAARAADAPYRRKS